MRVTTSLYGEVVVLPFRVGAPMTETLTWMTDVIQAHDGTEEAFQVRTAPRQEFDMGVPVPQNDKALGFNMLYGAIGETWAAPVWSEYQEVGPISAGDAEISAVLGYSDFRDNSLAILWQSPEDFEIVEIERVGSGVLDLIGVVQGAYATAKLMPVRIGRIAPSAQRQVSRRHSRLTLSFEVDDHYELPVAEPTQFEGYDLFTRCPMMSGIGLDDQISTRADLVDAELGVVRQFTPWTFNRKTRALRRVAKGAEAIWEHREWLYRRAGKYRPFWWPTFERELELVSTGALTTMIEVNDTGHTEFADVREHIAVFLNDGTVLPRVIQSHSLQSAGTVDLVLTESLGVDASEVDKISYLGLMRLDADRVELQHMGARVMVSEVPVVEIRP